MAYAGADLFVRALRDAGPRADTADVSRVLERTQTAPDALGNPAFVLSPPMEMAWLMLAVNCPWMMADLSSEHAWVAIPATSMALNADAVGLYPFCNTAK